MSRREILLDINAACDRAERQYGKANDTLDDGTGPDHVWLMPYTLDGATDIEKTLRRDYEKYEDDNGLPTWLHVLREEVAEAALEDDLPALRAEVLDVAQVAVSWLERIDRRIALQNG